MDTASSVSVAMCLPSASTLATALMKHLLRSEPSISRFGLCSEMSVTKTAQPRSTWSRSLSSCRPPLKLSASKMRAMKLKFKTQAYQTAAVQAVVDCFKGQPPVSTEAISYRIDPGKAKKGVEYLFGEGGFKNAGLKLTDIALLEKITDKFSINRTYRSCRLRW